MWRGRRACGRGRDRPGRPATVLGRDPAVQLGGAEVRAAPGGTGRGPPPAPGAATASGRARLGAPRRPWQGPRGDAPVHLPVPVGRVDVLPAAVGGQQPRRAGQDGSVRDTPPASPAPDRSRATPRPSRVARWGGGRADEVWLGRVRPGGPVAVNWRQPASAWAIARRDDDVSETFGFDISHRPRCPSWAFTAVRQAVVAFLVRDRTLRTEEATAAVAARASHCQPL